MTDREALVIFIHVAETFAKESDDSKFELAYTTSSGYRKIIKVEIADSELDEEKGE